MQSAELWMIFATSENLQLFKFSCFYNVNLLRKTDEGGFQPQLCTLHSALCTRTDKLQFKIKKGFIMHDELTEVDIKKMQEEVDYRMCVLRPQLLAEVQRTREYGDLSENAEYKEAKREKNKNESRIRYLKNMIATAKVIKVRQDDDSVCLFDTVTYYVEEDEEEEERQIVTTLRQDVLKGYLSKESPLGKALLGKKVGDRVLVKVNDNYSYYVEVRAIKKGHDDENIPISSY